MTLPNWAFYGLGGAFLEALMPLVQERRRASPLATAFGNKFFVALFTLPVALSQGLPAEASFYIAIAITSLMWCVSDVFYFRTVAAVGAGPVSRLLAGMMVPGFVLWLIVNPSLVVTYLQEPWRAAGIAGCVVAASWLAVHLSRCTVTRQTARLLWFTLVAAVVGPTLFKLTLATAAPAQAPFAFPFVEALFMVTYWSLYSTWRHWRSVDHAHGLRQVSSSLRQADTLKAVATIGLLNGGGLILHSLGVQAVEHPSYITILNYTDVLWIILIYKLAGRREDANVWAGLGLTACAAALILLKTL